MSEREIPENASSTESGDISALLEAFRKQFYTSSTERCIFVPVRHHSPVCGLQLKELIQNFSPDLILIEGPADGTHLIETLLRNDCRPPVAIYSFFVDHKNKLGLNGRLTPSLGIPFRYASWHPFLSYSPEYVAMKEGMKRKARIEFIDLGLNDRIKVLIKEFSTIDEQKLRTIQTSSQDESSLTESLYIKELVKKTGCRDLNEWWFRSMEIPGIQESPEEFFSKVFTFVAISRSLIKEEVLFFERFREDYMASLITKALAEFPNKKALVVTGGLHTVALFEKLSVQKARKKRRLKSAVEVARASNVCITPFSYPRLSEISGYAAGIPYPWYCQLIFDNGKVPESFNLAALATMVNFGKGGENIDVSTAERIAAVSLAYSLRDLREISSPGPFEIVDSMKSVLLKDDLSENRIEATIEKVMNGTAVGEIPKGTGTLPLVQNFYEEIRLHKLPKNDQKRQVKFDIYRKETHREKSRFLHSLKVLDVNYGDLRSGPDFLTSTRTDLITEVWDVSWNPSVDSELVEMAGYGPTISEATKGRLEETFFSSSIDKRPVSLFKAAQTGQYDLFRHFLDHLMDRLPHEQDFLTLVSFTKVLVLLFSAREAILPKQYSILVGPIRKAFERIEMQIPRLSVVPEEKSEGYSSGFRNLAQMLNLEILKRIVDPNEFLNEFQKTFVLTADSRLQGLIAGLLISFGRLRIQDINRVLTGYLYGSQDSKRNGIIFLEGVLSLSKGSILTLELINVLNEAIKQNTDDEFVRVLPNLRRIFSSLSPREIDYVGQQIAKILHKDQEEGEFTHFSRQTTSKSQVYKDLDKILHRTLNQWYLGVGDE